MTWLYQPRSSLEPQLVEQEVVNVRATKMFHNSPWRSKLPPVRFVLLCLAWTSCDAFSSQFPAFNKGTFVFHTKNKPTHSHSSFSSPSWNQQTNLQPSFMPRFMSPSSSPEPDETELAQQKLETAQGYADYNDGTWLGRRITSFSVKSDVAAGVTKLIHRHHSQCGKHIQDEEDENVDEEQRRPLYETSSRTTLEADGLTVQETWSWQNDDNNNPLTTNDPSNSPNNPNTNNNNICVFSRTLQLSGTQCSIDIDSVDGTYTLDSSLMDLPAYLTGTSGVIKFGVEHSLAMSDHERTRCFCLYGLDDGLMRVVVCDEVRKQEQKTGETGKKFKAGLGKEEELDAAKEEVDRFMDQLLGGSENKEEQVNGGTNPVPDILSLAESTPSSSASTGKTDVVNGVKQRVGPDTTMEEKMELLQRAMAKAAGNNNANANNNANDNNGWTTQEDNNHSPNHVIARCPMSMFGLTNGVWLGDAIVRQHATIDKNEAPGKNKRGFARGGMTKKKNNNKGSKPKPGSGMSDGFAEWATGVQKVAMTFQWDYDKKVMQRIDAGRSMGASLQTSSSTSKGYAPLRSSVGTLVVHDMARGLDAERRLMYIDFDMGAYAGFMVGSVYVKAPRVLSSTRPFHTECAVFQKRTTTSTTDGTVADVSDIGVDLASDSGSDGTEKEKEEDVPEWFCSRVSRVYGPDGRLTQGSSAFFTLQAT